MAISGVGQNFYRNNVETKQNPLGDAHIRKIAAGAAALRRESPASWTLFYV